MELSVRDISIDLGVKPVKRVLSRVSFEAGEGEFVSLLGASGAGKSTLLRIVAGILLQDSGSVVFDGSCIDDTPAHKREVGFVFQDMRLFPHMNAEENVAFPCKMRGMPKKQRLAWARELLCQVQLEGFGGRDVTSLSGGQRQRVALARALAAKPRILLLDEPFSGLDEHLRDDMRSLVLRLHRDFTMTTLMVTHDALEALEMSDRIVYLDAGRVMQSGTPQELYEHPASKEIAACFGSCSVLRGVVEGGEFRAGPLRMPSFGCAAGAASAVVRHAGVRMVRCGSSSSALVARCCVYCGSGYLVRLDVDGQTLSVFSPDPVEKGASVALEYDKDSCFVYAESRVGEGCENMADEARILDCATVEDYLARAFDMRRALGIPEGAVLRVRLIARGEYNVNYAFCHPVTGKHLLFRINLGSQMHLARQIEYEAHALELLATSGRTPRVFSVDGSGSYYGKGVLVEEMLPGRPLDYATDLEEAARILADIHAVEVVPNGGLVRPIDPIGALVEECRSMFDVYRAWPGASETVVSSVGKLFAHVEAHRRHCDAPMRLHIVSTELNSGNFLINEGARSFLVDWEKPLAGEAEQDLAHFLAPTTTFWKTDTLLDRNDMDLFLACYCDAVGDRFDTAGVRNRVNDYMAATCLRGLTWCAMAYAQHESGMRCVADEYTLGKVKAYLTEEFFETIWRVCAEQ